ncbi:hypothetical protein PV327_011307 [Microctonus hyperodae]|uniref:DUF8207 domain-containing protein n=1 Tax=Microctonus hyperodae TaxID=165561 RepID=A0AA39FL64_MICHY|nr:hypothetical protein PV327_011307 [Microctonus hyperodae]
MNDTLNLIVKPLENLVTTSNRMRQKIKDELADIRMKNEPDQSFATAMNYDEGMQTPGLIELLFIKSPNESIISDIDEENYMNIINSTNALYKRYDPDGSLMMNKSLKYQNYIAKNIKHKSGRGLPYDKIAERRTQPYYVALHPLDDNDAVSMKISKSYVQEEIHEINQTSSDLRSYINEYNKNMINHKINIRQTFKNNREYVEKELNKQRSGISNLTTQLAAVNQLSVSTSKEFKEFISIYIEDLKKTKELLKSVKQNK